LRPGGKVFSFGVKYFSEEAMEKPVFNKVLQKNKYDADEPDSISEKT
jgi:hypothetical protein